MIKDKGKYKGVHIGYDINPERMREEKKTAINELAEYISKNLYEISFVSFIGGIKQLLSIKDFEIAVNEATALEVRHCVRYGVLPIADGGIYLRKGKI